jgi:hypothetical protein
MVVAGAHRRLTVPKRGDRALQRVEQLAVVGVGRWVRMQPVERRARL